MTLVRRACECWAVWATPPVPGAKNECDLCDVGQLGVLGSYLLNEDFLTLWAE